MLAFGRKIVLALQPVVAALTRQIRKLPAVLRHSLTRDRGHGEAQSLRDRHAVSGSAARCREAGFRFTADRRDHRHE